MRNLLLFAIIVTTMFTACQKENLIENQSNLYEPNEYLNSYKESAKEFFTHEEKVDYIIKGLESYKDFFIFLINTNSVANKFIINKFDAISNDECHLILDIRLFNDLGKLRNVNMPKLLEEYNTIKGLNIEYIDLVSYFRNVNGQNFYPEIKFFKSENNKSLLYKNEMTYMVYDGDESKIKFIGEKYVNNKKIENSNVTVTEEYAMNNILFIFTVSELPEEDILKYEKTSEAMVLIDAKMQKLKVMSHKETWVSGASEVCMIAQFTTYNGLALAGGTTGLPICVTDGSAKISCNLGTCGTMLREIKRKDVSDGVEFTINFPILDDFNVTGFTTSQKVCMVYVIFEYDPLAGGKYASLQWGTMPSPLYLSFPSVDGCYAGGTMYTLSDPSYLVSNTNFIHTYSVDFPGSIKFNCVP